jgi:hypothetical protein
MIIAAVRITAGKIAAFGVSIEMANVCALRLHAGVPSDAKIEPNWRALAGPVVEAKAGPYKIGQSWAGATGI